MDMEIVEHRRKSYIEIGKIYFWTATINKWQHILETDDCNPWQFGTLKQCW